MSHVIRKPVLAICEQHPRSLISAFLFRCLDNIISIFALYKISSHWDVSVDEQASWSLTSSEIPKTGFVVTRLNYVGPSLSLDSNTTRGSLQVPCDLKVAFTM